MRARLTLAFKYKLLIYFKICIFSLFYILGFIVVNIIIIYYHLNYYINGFIFNYYLNIALEQFFSIILAILFYPLRNSKSYFVQVNYDFKRTKFITEINNKNEKSIKINNLTPKLMKEEYIKYEYPLILVEPFAKNDNVFGKVFSVHIGIAKEKLNKNNVILFIY